MPIFIDTPGQWRDHQRNLSRLALKGKHGREVKIPCVDTVLVIRHLVQANTYNPNGMPDQKREDLIESILLAGFAYGVASWWDDDLEKFVVVDGFHRWLVSGFDDLGLAYVPVTPLDLTPPERMMATWMFNKARGFHQVDLDAELIRSLIEQGVNEEEIVKHLGIDLDTVHRYKQVTGIAELFRGAQYSMAWEIVEVSDNGDN